MRTLTVLLWACSTPEAPLPEGAGPGLAAPERPDEEVAEAARIGTVPIYGGTLEPVAALDALLASDPDGDRLVLIPVDGAEPTVVDLGDNARPFRLQVERTLARATLRGTGEVVEVDLAEGAVRWRSKVCAEPRGLASVGETLVVACAGGELVELLASSGKVLRTKLFRPDLRDVVFADGQLYVSRFRSAEVMGVDAASLEPTWTAFVGTGGTAVIWRLRPSNAPSGGVTASFQEASKDVVTSSDTLDSGESSSAYASFGCDAMHQTRMAHILPDRSDQGGAVAGVVLPVDFVAYNDGIALVNAGVGAPRSDRPRDRFRSVVSILPDPGVLTRNECSAGPSMPAGIAGQPTAVASLDGALYVQTQNPASVWQVGFGDSVPLWRGGDLTDMDPSFALFHQEPGSGVSCASCHPEGEDDGHVWDFGPGVEGVVIPGPRRTLTLSGGISARAPYHWMGELPTDDDLVRSSFTGRMGGPELEPAVVDDLFEWLDGLRAVRAAPSADAAELERGRQVFLSAGCATCHAGPDFTDGRIWNVRTKQPGFKTPSLVGLGMRTSFLHDGCAQTVMDRLVDEACGGGDAHGTTSDLSRTELKALESYLLAL